jgi:hypothetical protein
MGRVEECRSVLDSNIKRFTDLSAKPYRGSEVVNAQGVVGWEDAVTKEIASFLVDEFTVVRDAIVRYEKSGGGDSDDVRA